MLKKEVAHQVDSDAPGAFGKVQPPLPAPGKTDWSSGRRTANSSSPGLDTAAGGRAALRRLWPLLSVLSTMNRSERVKR